MRYLKTTFPYLLIQKGKHGDSYYHIDSPEAFDKAMLSIFNMQKENGYYGFDSKPKIAANIASAKEELKLLEALQNSPTGHLIRALTDDISSKKSLIRYWEYELRNAHAYELILDGNTNLIYEFLVSRLDSQYEYIETATYS